ncbi:MAG: nucleoside kinase [Clostridiales bacterium]|jgi:uridine kinase|nr:nucleoside kinase [Eubacteriales bacterium]MDH7565436.1 nucleoside kinase [Clostridiales bacterium]
MKENEVNLIKVSFPDGSEKIVEEGISLAELAAEVQSRYRYAIVAAKVDNDIKELNFHLYGNCKVQFIDMTDEDGMRIYRRSLYFILIKAVHDLFPDRKLIISHSISKGVYCEIRGDKELDQEEVEKIEARMRELVRMKTPFTKKTMTVEAAKEMFLKSGRMDRFHIVEYRQKPYVTIYNCDGLEDYLYGYMVPDTGFVKSFKLIYYPPGLILMCPETSNPDVIPEFQEQKKLFAIFKEYKRWVQILGVENVGALNGIIKAGQISDFIRVSEALHEKKIAQIADMITEDRHRKKVVLISGPSSSGKTTFAHRLAIQLRVNGFKPVTISLDDYFVDREHTPLDENGEYDFEALEAVDIKLFNAHLSDLICGREVEIPIFNFATGSRESVGRRIRINDDQIMIIEGIHGLNDRLTESIPRENKFKIYVSALTSMNIDDHNRIQSTDTRIVRRIVRDFQFRGNTAISTIKRWPSVRRGEERNIFPYQECADIMFNSFLIYELSVLKTLAEPLLAEIDRIHPEYSEAKRLIEFLSNFLPVEPREIPANSIIREFIGGSCFY